jgi:MFS family permease
VRKWPVASYLRVLSHRDFRYLFVGQSLSVIGDRVVIVAIALYVTQRTGSATDLGLVLGTQAAVLVTLVLLGGVWADRLPRHRIMIATDTARAALHALLAILILTGVSRIWELVAIEACYGAAEAFFQPAYTGLVPQTVPEPLIQDARALTESMANLALLLGPALATAIVLGIGAGEAFAFDAATFVVSALFLMRMNPRTRGAAPASSSVLGDLRAGWREVASRPWVWVTIAAFTGSLLCVLAQWFTLAPGVARSAYGSAGVFGVVQTIVGAGAVIGSAVALRWRPRFPLKTGLILMLMWPLLSTALSLLAPEAVLALLALATGFGFSTCLIWWETALAHHIPPHALSRVSSYDWMGSLALLPVGYFVAGPLATTFGARAVLGVGSGIGIALLLLALTPRATRTLPGPPAEELAPPQSSSSRAISV